MDTKLSDLELEEAYDLVAEAIDSVGPELESLFLAKLCLALARNSENLEAVRDAIALALEDPAEPDSP